MMDESQLTVYERTQCRKIKEWEAAEPGIVGRAASFLAKPVGGLVQMIPTGVVAAALKSANFVGKNLQESNIRKEFDLIIVAIKRAAGDLVFNPGPREVLEAGDTLISLGRQTDLARICELL